MKPALIVAAMLSLLLPSVSLAQSDQHTRPAAPGNRPANPGRPPSPGKPNRPRPPHPQPPRPQPVRPQPGRPPHHAPPHHARPPHYGPPPHHARPPQGGRPGFHRPPYYVQPLPPRGNQFWHRGQYYGRIHGPAFAYPSGWRYRQWQIGQRLPPLFLAPTYFYPGWSSLGLQAPVEGYSWVRFGPDLLLVNLSTGEVEDVVYGVFL